MRNSMKITETGEVSSEATSDENPTTENLTTPSILSRSGSLPTPRRFYNKWAALVVFIFLAGFGSLLLSCTFVAALQSIATVEAETFTLPANGVVISDPSASGSKAIQLRSNGTATKQISLPSISSQITVHARGIQCEDAPQLVLEVDGVQQLSTAVSATSWTNYSVTTNTTAGNRTLSVSFTNGYYGDKNCDGDLLIDEVTFLGTAPTSPPPSESVRQFPTDAGFISVKNYGAKGDGVTDDTDAIKQAIAENVGYNRTLLFPAGTYLVSSQMDWRNSAGQWRSYLTFQGEGVDHSVMKLKDNTPGFTNAASPLPVLRPGSKTDDAACSNYGQNNGDGGGNCAFGNYIFDMTINTGSGNLGAIGVDFIASNWGGMINTKVTSDDGKGATGISMQRESGPGLLKNVHVNGFDVGILVSRQLYSMTLEHITLTNQLQAGIRNEGNTLAIRDVKSTNSVSAIVNASSGGLISIVDSVLQGGSSSVNAIDNQGGLFARNITTSGYQSALKSGTSNFSGATISEFSSQPAKSLSTSTGTSLNVPIQETPEFHDPVLANWANVENYGASKNDSVDDSSSIQAAIDSGKKTVYLPFGDYIVNNTIIVRGNVKRIIGFSSNIDGTANPSFRVESVAGPSVIIERLRVRTIEHASEKAVAVKHVQYWDAAFVGNSGKGSWFFEDYCCGKINISNQTVWARQLDVETESVPQIQNTGGTLWILGLKTERTATNISTTAGGNTELLGGLLYPIHANTGVKAFTVSDAYASLTYSEVAFAEDRNFDILVEETQNGQTRQLLRNDVQLSGYGSIMSLYTNNR